jgi:chemotaxis protein CheD
MLRKMELIMDLDGSAQQVFLQPGEIYVTEKPAIVSTLLGSCVAVTMFSLRKGFASICHGLLPTCKGEKPCSCEGFCKEGVRYVDCSIMRMLGWFVQNGIARDEIVVKVFGGSEMMGSGMTILKESVGHRNIITAFSVIEKEMLSVAASDVGGVKGRKIIFSTKTGEVLLKRLQKSELEIHGYELR